MNKAKTTKKAPLIFGLWKEGKYVDMWNLPHFFISLLIGFILIYLNTSILVALISIIILKTCWEVYEHFYVIKEDIHNKILDVVTGVLAILTIYYLNSFYPVSLIGFFITLLLTIAFSYWGLYSMKKLDLFIK